MQCLGLTLRRHPGTHTHKGDRLPLAPKNIPTVPSRIVTALSRPPIGCEPAFVYLLALYFMSL